MSDSDCSNCDLDCEFRDYHYNCFVRASKEIKKLLSLDDIRILKEAKEIKQKIYDEVDIGEIETIIEMYDAKTENMEE